MNKERLLSLTIYLKNQVTDEDFEFGDLNNCIIGHGMQLFALGTGNDPNSEYTLGAYLGLALDLSNNLFFASNLEIGLSWQNISRTAAYNVIQHLVKTGEVDWMKFVKKKDLVA